MLKLFILLNIFLILLTKSNSQNLDPNDSLFYLQKRIFDKLNVIEAWKITNGNKEIKIGVIDNGFDFFHPDLYGQLIPGYYAPGTFHTETYGNIAHGTLVAGIIAAKSNNVIGMSGMAPFCKIITASYGSVENVLLKYQQKFFKENPDSNMASFVSYIKDHSEEIKKFTNIWGSFIIQSTAESINYLVAEGVRVINISGFYSKKLCKSAELWEKLENSFRYAAKRNVLIVLGAGNNSQEIEDYPGSTDSIIIVGASTIDDNRWNKEYEINRKKIIQGSNYGNRLTVMAPTDSIIVCNPSDKRFYLSEDGPNGKTDIFFEGAYSVLQDGATSAATPIVTSLVALILSINPNLDIVSVRDLIINGCDDIGEKGFDIYTGYGRVNFFKTLSLIKN